MPGITDPTEALFKDGTWCWDGTQWRKLALVWGYSDRWAENLGGTQSNAGTYTGQTVAVPAGEVYVLQLVTARNIGSAPSTIMIELYDGTRFYVLNREATPAQYVPVDWQGAAVLKEGDKVQVRMTGCGDGDAIEAVAWGYKMKIAE